MWCCAGQGFGCDKLKVMTDWSDRCVYKSEKLIEIQQVKKQEAIKSILAENLRKEKLAVGTEIALRQ